jgi:asparagine synthase (glutamine-hydrolysing)
MTAALRHRGPDGAGFHADAHAALGHRRLAIIDLVTGHQPMSNEAGDAWIVYNGEIFNHVKLRQELERAGHRYTTRSDTETILHAAEEYGIDCVTRLRGMFAFAIWNQRTKTLFCARDRLGIKPFYYYWDGRLFAFASEIKALLQHPQISPTVERSLLTEHLAFGYSSDDRTLFAGIRKLMPGHRLVLTRDGVEITRYWQVPPPTVAERHNDDWWIRECRVRLEEAVQAHLVSDVPVGVFLSGGIDSSLVTALTARMTSGPVKTFAVGYREQRFSELDAARHAARSIGTEHREVVVSMDDFFDVLPSAIWHEDEPLAWPSSVALYFASRLAAEHVKVVLTGEGSDELFAGYGRYRLFELNQRWLTGYRLLPAQLRRAVQSTIAHASLLSASQRRKLQHTVLGRGAEFESLYVDNFYSAFSRDEQRRLLASPEIAACSPYRSFLPYWNASGEGDIVPRLLYADQCTYLVELLMKQDQMSMACSVESRVPYLDHVLVEFAARVPGRVKLRSGVGKYIVKRGAEDVLPPDIIHRKKAGFPTPLGEWLRDPRAVGVFAALRDPDGLLAAYVDSHELDALLERHRSGREDATDRIWRLLNLQLWGAIFVTGQRHSLEPLLSRRS